MTMLAYKECLPPYLQHNSTERYVQKKQLTPAPPRREARTGQEFFLTKDWLHEEVTRERNKNVPEGETPWYHLAGTGFFNKAQVEQLLRNVQGVGKEAFPDVLNLELSKVKVDIESFVDEYLKQMLTLRFNLSWENIDGEKKVYCPDYGVTWESITGKSEREGAVYAALFGGNSETGKPGVESWLQTAPANSYAVVVSPQGWSGMQDADGDAIAFPETQVYAIRKNEQGKLQAYTFRYKASILENHRFQELLGLETPQFSTQKEWIKDTLKNTALIRGDDPDRKVNSFEDIVNFMQQSVNDREVAYEGKTFGEIRTFLQNPEAFSRRHPLVDPLITRFLDYARDEVAQRVEDPALKKDLMIGLAVTITQLNRLYLEQEQQEKTHIYAQDLATSYGKNVYRDIDAGAAIAFMQRMQGDINYHQEKNNLQERPGCGGGGKKPGEENSMMKILSGGASRNAEKTNSGSDNYDFDQVDTCVVCNEGPQAVGPCKICRGCDANMGGKAAKE